jgi:hypothetical protein
MVTNETEVQHPCKCGAVSLVWTKEMFQCRPESSWLPLVVQIITAGGIDHSADACGKAVVIKKSK